MAFFTFEQSMCTSRAEHVALTGKMRSLGGKKAKLAKNITKKIGKIVKTGKKMGKITKNGQIVAKMRQF